MDKKLTNYFIENQAYLQNPPITAQDFIKLAKERNIHIDMKES